MTAIALSALREFWTAKAAYAGAREPTLAMIQRLHGKLGIPAESLLKQSGRRRAA